MAFKRWLLKHRILASVLAAVILSATYVFIELYFDIDDNTLVISIYAAAMMFALLSINLLPLFMMKKPLEQLMKNGDPEPLAQVTGELLNYKLSKSNALSVKINHCVALRECGQLQEAYDILRTIAIDKAPYASSQLKMIYYNNLYDACNLLGDNDQAEFWLNKALDFYNTMPENKFKKALINLYLGLSAEKHYRNGNYDEATKTLDNAVINSLGNELGTAYTRAQIAVKLGKTDEAKRLLEGIVANGNKLYCVTLAKNLLNEIDNQN